MDIIIGVIILVILLFAARMLFPRRSSTGERQVRSGKTESVAAKPVDAEITRWRSVKISPGLFSCTRVRKIADRIYLATEAPALPLGQCSEKGCQCKYIYLSDRRSSEDRRAMLKHLSQIYLNYQNDDRRQILGRRISDIAA